MIANNPLIVFIPTTDAGRARLFYESKLGLRFASEDPFAIVMEANGVMVRIVRVGDFTPAPFTLLGWQVEDIHSSAAALKDHGIVFNHYPNLNQSSDGVWSSPDGTKVAWFFDPDGNTLSISQH